MRVHWRWRYMEMDAETEAEAEVKGPRGRKEGSREPRGQPKTAAKSQEYERQMTKNAIADPKGVSKTETMGDFEA